PPLHAGHGTPTAHAQAAPDARPLHRRAKVLRLLFLQKPQNTFAWSGISTAVLLTVPESSTKAIGRAPRLLAGGGGQSWLVGTSPLSGFLTTGVHVSPSFGPPSHALVAALQIGHG